MARGDIEVARAKWEQEVSALRQRVIEAELGIRDIEQQWVQVQISRLRVQHEALQQYVKKLLPLQRLSAEEIEQQRALMGARTKLITEIDEAKAANAQRLGAGKPG
jgi:predicted RNA-binding Zn ribbon-like protein